MHDQNYEEALLQIRKLKQEFPSSFVVWNIAGVSQKLIGDFTKAKNCFKMATTLNVNFAEGYNNLGVILKLENNIPEAESCYHKAIKLDPSYAEPIYNLGNLLVSEKKINEAILAYKDCITIKEDYLVAINALAGALRSIGKFDEAIVYHRQARAVNPQCSTSRTNYADTLTARRNYQLAIAEYKSAINISPNNFHAHCNLGFVLNKVGDYTAAISSCSRAVQINPEFVYAHEVLGDALQKKGNLEAAVRSYKSGLKIDPKRAPLCKKIADIFKSQEKFQQAINYYNAALNIKPDYADVYNNMGNLFLRLNRIEKAISCYQRALETQPELAAAEAQFLHLKQGICDFDYLERLADRSGVLGIVTDPVPHFAALSWNDNPREQLSRAENYARHYFKNSKPYSICKDNVDRKRIRVGYFSSDFYNHATMFLFAGTLREHDRDNFEIFVYSYGTTYSEHWHEKIHNHVDHFFDVSKKADLEIVEFVLSHGLDIAIDLKGYTTATRSSIFQSRLAPIQINYLGYPGSMGVTFIDYIVADPIIIPPEQREFYSEKVIYLPNSYQPNDNKRTIAKVASSRRDFGLPEESFVLCCFNNNYKIGLNEFGIWMRLLNKIPNSVLWLFKSNKLTEENLAKEALKRNVDPGRIIFAERLSQDEHLSRHQHADLFVDTFNYNAHTTASDALWSGLPVVTKQGKQFSARVASSLLHAMGLQELVTNSEDEYERLIFRLAMDKNKLVQLRTKLNSARFNEPLFDTEQYTLDFENGLKQAYTLHKRKKPPQDIWITENQV